MNANLKFVILAIVLIFVVSFASGFAFGMSNNFIGVVVGNVIIIFSGLTIVGCMIPENRWSNIIHVAAGLWLMSVVNVVFFGTSVSSWMWSIGVIAILAVLSGVFSLLITAFIKAGASKS